MIDKKDQKIQELKNKSFLEKKFAKFWFDRFKSLIKVLNASVFSAFVKCIRPEKRLSFDQIQQMIEGNEVLHEDFFMVVGHTRVYFFTSFGDSKAKFSFGLKDLREAYFHVELRLVK